jgi:carbonic anhydrase
MSVTEVLLERNARFQARYSGPGSLEPTLRSLVLTCADQRVDPAHILGIDLNESIVLRNAGGRVTPEVLNELALLGTIAAIEGMDPGFELIVVHHTDCGTARLGDSSHHGLLARYFGIDPSDVPGKCVTDPAAAVMLDIAELARNPFVPSTLKVAGLVYHVETGAIEIVRPATPLSSVEPSSVA